MMRDEIPDIRHETPDDICQLRYGRVRLFPGLCRHGLGMLVILLFMSVFQPLQAGEDKPFPIEVDTTLTIKQIARRNQVPAEKLAKYLSLSPEQETCRPMQAGCTVQQIEAAIFNIRSINANKASNNWFFALAKFAKWALKLLAKVFMQS